MAEMKVALVTGGSRGIGKACAIELAKAGYDVAISYAGNEEAANKTIEELQELNVKAKSYKFDVSDKEACAKAVEEVIAEFGTMNLGTPTSGAYISKTAGGPSTSSAWSYTDFLPINGTALMFTCPEHSNATLLSVALAIAFYTSNDQSTYIANTGISPISGTTGNYKWIVVSVPATAKYFRASILNAISSSYQIIELYTYNSVYTSDKNLAVASSPNLDSSSIDFHNLAPNKIFYKTNDTASPQPSNMPYENWQGTLFTLKGTNVNTAQFIVAIGAQRRIHICRSWGAEPGTYSEWREVMFTDMFDNIAGLVGSASLTFTTTKEIKTTTIKLKAQTKYLVRVNGNRDGKIRMFPSTDSSNYAQLLPFKNEIIVYNNVNSEQNLAAYNVNGTADSFALYVYEIGSVEAKIAEIPTRYIVSKESHEADFTSVTECFLALKDDVSPKIIEIWEGEYDIYQEYLDASIPVCPSLKDENTSVYQEATENFWKYCVFVPKNSHVIGKGVVKLKWMPDPDDLPTGQTLTWAQCRAVSPINVMGSMTLENVEIYCKNGRYCIHNDTVGLAPYAGSVQKYINVKCYKYQSDNGAADTPSGNTDIYGTYHATGFGMGRSMLHYYENCEFHCFGTTQNYDGRAFYGHTNQRYNGVNITEEQSGEIVMNNCIMETPASQCLKLGNSGSVQRNVRVKFNDCYFSGRIDAINESGSDPVANAYDITFLNCGEVSVKYQDPDNPYTPKGYRTTVTIVPYS